MENIFKKIIINYKYVDYYVTSYHNYMIRSAVTASKIFCFFT